MDIAGLLIYMTVAGITPGPNNIMCMYLGANGGFRSARKFMTASMGSLFVKMLLCGLLNILLASVIPGVVPYLKWLGAAYMVYLGVHILLTGIRESKKAAEEHAEAEHEEIHKGAGSTYRDGILLQILNIKSWVYALSIFSIYIVPHTTHFSVILLWSVIATVQLILFSLLWCGFGTAIKKLYAKYRVPCDAVMCMSLLYCAVTALL